MTQQHPSAIPVGQTPDSLGTAPVPEVQAPVPAPHADTAQARVTAPAPHRADTVGVARHALPAGVPHAATGAPADSLGGDTLGGDAALPRCMQSVIEPDEAGPDSTLLAWTRFQEPDGGCFQDSPYWHPELPVRCAGLPCTPIPYRVSADSPTACAVLVCLVMLVYMLLRYGGELRTQMHDFFLPARIRQGHHQGLSTAQGLLSMPYVCLMLSVMGSIGVSVAEQDRLALLPDVLSRLRLQGFYAAVWLAYFFLRANSYAFINWIFFDKSARREWHDTLFHVQALECVLLYPVLLVMVYRAPAVQVFVWGVLSVIAIAKLLLLYKAQRLFFVKIYGALHLIVYFCTLEVAPLWVVLKLLTHITDLLQVK